MRDGATTSLGRKMTKVLVLPLMLACLASGCASVSSAYAGATGDARILSLSMLPDETFAAGANAGGTQPMKFPMRLAVVGTERNPNGRFADLESSGLETALLERDGLFADVVGLPEFLASGTGERNLASLLTEARRAGADSLLVYETRMTAEQGTTPLVVLNVTLIGAWVVPSLTYGIELDTRAALVDVATGRVRTTVRDERRASSMSPSAIVDGSAKSLRRELRAETFSAIRDGLVEKIERLQAEVERDSERGAGTR